MTLRQGSRVVYSWSGNGTGFLTMTKATNVSSGLTYTLTVSATVNGNAISPVTVQATNN